MTTSTSGDRQGFLAALAQESVRVQWYRWMGRGSGSLGYPDAPSSTCHGYQLRGWTAADGRGVCAVSGGAFALASGVGEPVQ